MACLWWPERAALDGQVTGLTAVMAGGLGGVLGRPLAAQVPHAIADVAAHQSQICLVIVLCASAFSPAGQRPFPALLLVLMSHSAAHTHESDCVAQILFRRFDLLSRLSDSNLCSLAADRVSQLDRQR